MTTSVDALKRSYDKYLAILNQYKYGCFDQKEYPGWITEWQHCNGAVVLIQWHESEPDKKINTFRALSREEAKIIANSLKYRWIKLSEAKPEELPSNHEEVELLCYPQMRHGQKNDEYYYTKGMYIRDETGGYSFYPYFTWSAVEEFISDPEIAKRIYADRTYLHIRNIAYFRRINKEDMPAFEPRKKFNL